MWTLFSFFYFLKHQLEVVGWKICLIFTFMLHEIVDIADIFKISRVEKSWKSRKIIVFCIIIRLLSFKKTEWHSGFKFTKNIFVFPRGWSSKLSLLLRLLKYSSDILASIFTGIRLVERVKEPGKWVCDFVSRWRDDHDGASFSRSGWNLRTDLKFSNIIYFISFPFFVVTVLDWCI